MSAAAAIRDPAHSLVERYEELREAVLTSSDPGFPGLASVRRQGLWAWVELVRAAPDTPPPRQAGARPRRHPSPPAVQAELVDVWVNLVLGRAGPVEAR